MKVQILNRISLSEFSKTEYTFSFWVTNFEVKVKVLVVQSCPTLCTLVDCRLPGSSVPGILQARILEWVAIPFSRGSS